MTTALTTRRLGLPSDTIQVKTVRATKEKELESGCRVGKERALAEYESARALLFVTVIQPYRPNRWRYSSEEMKTLTISALTKSPLNSLSFETRNW